MAVMRLRSVLLFVALVFAAACRGEPPREVGADAAPASISLATPPMPDALDAGAVAPAKLIADEELGPLVEKLSEKPGEFPSDNFVSNETSFLDVMQELRDPALRGRAYVGVGPEQNFTYVAALEPATAYVVDIRRGNLLEHMVLRGCFETGESRAAFLTALLARRQAPSALVQAGDFDSLERAFASSTPERALYEEGVARTKALMDRLHLARTPKDDADIARIHDAFFSRGLALAYTMKNSGRKYPSLGELLAAREPGGPESSFLASDATYERVRRFVLANRLIPVVGDFGGKHALLAVADDMRARGLTLGAFYTSNVEQYLFDSATYPNFVASVRAMPRDDASLLLRVWFDQGKPHPQQRKGHRTTSLAMNANVFVQRADKKPFKSFWEVVTTP